MGSATRLAGAARQGWGVGSLGQLIGEEEDKRVVLEVTEAGEIDVAVVGRGMVKRVERRLGKHVGPEGDAAYSVGIGPRRVKAVQRNGRKVWRTS